MITNLVKMCPTVDKMVAWPTVNMLKQQQENLGSSWFSKHKTENFKLDAKLK